MVDATEGVDEPGLDMRAPLPTGPVGAGVLTDEGVTEGGDPTRDVSDWGVGASVVEGAGVLGGASPGFFLAFRAARSAAPRPPEAAGPPPRPPGGGCPLDPSIATLTQGSLDRLCQQLKCNNTV